MISAFYQQILTAVRQAQILPWMSFSSLKFRIILDVTLPGHFIFVLKKTTRLSYKAQIFNVTEF